MELNAETEAGMRRTLNQKQSQMLIPYLRSKLPIPKKAELKDINVAALAAAEIKGYSNCIEDIEEIKDNKKSTNNNNAGNK